MNSAYAKELRTMGVKVRDAMKDKNGKVFAYFCLVPLSLIRYATYQRMKSGSQVKQMGEFVPIYSPPITLSLRASDLWSGDGQHRTLCAMGSDYTHIYATVCVGLTYEEEAKLFYVQNNDRRACNGWVKFKSAWQSRSPVHEQLVAICDEFNLTTPLNSSVSRTKDADIPAPVYLLWPESKGGIELVRAVCRVYSECWRVGSKKTPVRDDAKQTGLVRGLARFLKEYYVCENPLPWATIKMVLKNVEPASITELAKKQPSSRTDQKQYHQALCILFGKDGTKIKSPSCHLNRAA